MRVYLNVFWKEDDLFLFSLEVILKICIHYLSSKQNIIKK